MTKEGAIIINEYMQTSHEDVFAAGDSCAVFYNPTPGLSLYSVGNKMLFAWAH